MWGKEEVKSVLSVKRNRGKLVGVVPWVAPTAFVEQSSRGRSMALGRGNPSFSKLKVTSAEYSLSGQWVKLSEALP